MRVAGQRVTYHRYYQSGITNSGNGRNLPPSFNILYSVGSLTIMDVRKIACPECGKVYSVPVWSKQARCRVCRALLPLDSLRKEQQEEPQQETAYPQRRAA